MKNNLRFIFVVLMMTTITLTSAFACHFDFFRKKHLSHKTNNQIVLDNIKNENLSVYEGDEVIIRLKANPTTGYVWQLSVDSASNGVIELSEGKFIRPNNNLCGAQGVTEYTVKALKQGEANIHGVYVRPWLKDENSSIDNVEYSIEVKPLEN